MKTEKKPLVDSLNDMGNRIKEFGTVISVAGAILVSAGFIIKYVQRYCGKET